MKGFLRLLRERMLAAPPVEPPERREEREKPRAILSSTFELSLSLFKRAFGTLAPGRMLALAALGHAPPSGFGLSLGAAIAEVSEEELELILAQAVTLSLAQRSTRASGERAWAIHPLMADLLRSQGDERGMRGMTAWFLTRLPKGKAGEEDDQGQRWKAIQAEGDALASWLARVAEPDAVRVIRRGTQYAKFNGPFAVWAWLGERILGSLTDAGEQSDTLWMIANVSQSAGNLDRARAAAQQQGDIDRDRGANRDAAMAFGLLADILTSRGQLDEALRIRREEELPVYDRLGDVRSRAVMMGKIADILRSRGQLDEALRIRREEELPVYDRLGDVRSRLVARANLALIHLQRAAPGDRAEAAALLRLALADAEAMQIPEAAQIRAIQQDHGL